MKKILFLLLSTVAMYGQVPADATPLENIQITNNTTDNSATKVNVQSTDGTINTISKSDLVNVVEVDYVPSLPLVGEAGKIYVVKNVNKIYRWNGTFYQELAVTDISGKINVSEKGAINGVATLGSDGKVPNSQIPALAISETFPVNSQDQMLALSQADQGDVAIRSDISKSFVLRVLPSSVLGNWSELLTPTSAVTSVNGQVGVVTLSKSDVGLSNVDNTSDANKPVSTAQQTALNLKENTFTKNTAFNKNFGTTAGTVVEGGTLGSNAYSSTAYLPINDGYRTNFDFNSKLTSGFYNSLDSNVNNPLGQNYSQLIVAKGVDTGLQIAGGFNTDNLHFRGWSSSGSNFTPWRKVWHDGNFNPANYLPLSGNSTVNGIITTNGFKLGGTDQISWGGGFNSGKPLIEGSVAGLNIYPKGNLNDGILNVLGSAIFDSSVTATAHITAGGTASQYVKGDGSLSSTVPDSRPYKVYTALLTQSGTNAPVATVLENTLGGTVVWSREAKGFYNATLAGVFTLNKTTVLITQGDGQAIYSVYGDTSTNYVNLLGNSFAGMQLDNLLNKTTIEIRVYN